MHTHLKHRESECNTPTELHYRAYFGGPWLQAVGIATHKESHFLGREKASFSKEKIPPRKQTALLLPAESKTL